MFHERCYILCNKIFLILENLKFLIQTHHDKLLLEAQEDEEKYLKNYVKVCPSHNAHAVDDQAEKVGWSYVIILMKLFYKDITNFSNQM